LIFSNDLADENADFADLTLIFPSKLIAELHKSIMIEKISVKSAFSAANYIKKSSKY
jgi:hypothetical protein